MINTNSPVPDNDPRIKCPRCGKMVAFPEIIGMHVCVCSICGKEGSDVECNPVVHHVSFEDQYIT